MTSDAYYYDITKLGNQVYVADWGNGLRIIDVTSSSAPNEVAFYDTPEPAMPWGIEASENFVYLADFMGLGIANVSDPLNPYQTGYLRTPGTAFGIAIVDNKAYVADGEGGLRIVDVSNPEAPNEIGYHITPGIARDVEVVGDLAYVAARNGGLRVINISNPEAPYEVGYQLTSGGAYYVEIADNYAYVAAGYQGLRIINITNPNDPYEVGFYNTPDFSLGVTVVDNYAYVADRYEGLRIINVSNPSAPSEVGFYGMVDFTSNVKVIGNLAYLSDGFSGLRILDISNPTIPSETELFNTPGVAYDVIIQNNYAYVADMEGGLLILDILGEGYSISGKVNESSTGDPLPGVMVSDGAGHTTTTDGSGNYTLQGLALGTYTLTPTLAEYAFTPKSRTIYVPPDAVGINFSGIPNSALPDYTISAIEVTQAIQDLENNVPLISGKRTYARVHVHNQGEHSSTLVSARLCSSGRCLIPDNPGARIPILSNPDRGGLNQSYYFELPPDWLNSELNLSAEVNPVGSNRINESDYENNSFSRTVQFTSVPPLLLRLINVRYSTQLINRTWHQAEDYHYNAIESWLRGAYPINDSQVRRDNYILFEPMLAGIPGGIQVRQHLELYRALNILSGEDDRTLYYGMVDDGGAVIRGLGIINVAVGPTGNPKDYPDNLLISWDTDDSFGDWYAGHEIGHLLIGTLRAHAPCWLPGNQINPDSIDPDYPYPNGIIGGPTADTQRFFGFDVELVRLYEPTWHDMMTYCPSQWISDYNYDRIRNNLPASPSENRILAAIEEEVLVVIGQINTTQGNASYDWLFRSTSLSSPETPIAGTHTIKLLDAGENLLAEYPFTLTGNQDTFEGEDQILFFNQTIPWNPETQRVAVYSDTLELVSQVVSPNIPEVTLISPNGGEFITDTLTVSWTGSDADSDPLTYTVQYSNDDGLTWDTVGVGITNNVYTLTTKLIPGSDQARIKVIANDGINTGYDESDSAFAITKKAPTAKIISPQEGKHYIPGQTIILAGEGYDVEDGSLSSSALSWYSDISGLIGTGKMIDASDLTLGKHIITLTVMDSDGNISTDEIEIYIGFDLFLPYIKRD